MFGRKKFRKKSKMRNLLIYAAIFVVAVVGSFAGWFDKPVKMVAEKLKIKLPGEEETAKK